MDRERPGIFLSAHISWLFSERPYLERITAARDAGFAWIETAWPLDGEDVAGLPSAVDVAGVRVALLNCPAGDTDRNDRGFLNDPSRLEQVQRDFAKAAELADRLGVRTLNVLVGRALPGTPGPQRDAVVEALRTLAPQAEARGLQLLLEPLNTTENPGYLAPRPRDAVRLIEACGSGAFGLVLDVYHLACERVDPLTAIDDYHELIGHVQLADWPGRGPPGSGTLDFAAIVARLRERGYKGALGLEYVSPGSTETSPHAEDFQNRLIDMRGFDHHP